MEKLDYREQVKKAARLIDEKKGGDTVIFDVSRAASFTEYILVTTVKSSSQTNAVIKTLREDLGLKTGHVEGRDASWVLLDYDGFLINLFQPESRSFYGLERIWGENPRVEY